MMVMHAALIVAAYFLGAIPFGAVVARRRGVDILARGSGNIGATNVHRVLGKAAGLTVSLLDILKGFVPALTVRLLFPDSTYVLEWAFWTGMAAVVGHCFSPWLRFRGGKGVATGFGVLLGVAPIVAAGALAVFVLTTAATRYVSLASVAAATAVVVFGVVSQDPAPMALSYVALLLFVVQRHRGNLKRLLAGSEHKFSLKGGAEGEEPGAPASEHAEMEPGASKEEGAATVSTVAKVEEATSVGEM